MTQRSVRMIKVAVFGASLLPCLWLLADGLAGRLGANPIETISHRTGSWTLRFLLLTLAVTPLRRLLGWPWLIRLRRMIGLFAFFYAVLHFLTYLVLDQFFAWDEIARDIVKRPYITIGFVAFLLMWPLAITSTNRMQRRLGRNWQRLHRLVYVVAVGGVLHYLWLVKADVREPVIYGLILIVLLAYRSLASRFSAFPPRPGIVGSRNLTS